MPPSSHVTTSSFTNGQTLLSLEKFSHCTVASVHSHFPWVHVRGQDDLFVVMDNVRRLDVSELVVQKRVLKVAYRGELLETVELESLKAQAEDDNNRAMSQGLADVDRNMTVLAKGSDKKVAIRYRTLDRKIRKTQFAFQTENSFRVCVQELLRFRLPIKDLDGQSRPATTEQVYSQYAHQSRYQHNDQQERANPSSLSRTTPLDVPPRSFEQPVFQHQTSETPRSSQNSQAWCPPSAASQEYVPSSQPSQIESQPPPFGGLLPQPAMFHRPPLFRHFESRPYSAPETQLTRPLTESQALEALLPPVRELPFAKHKPAPIETPKAIPSVEPAKPAPKRKQIKQPKPRKRAARNGRAQTAQSTISAQVHKPTAAPKATKKEAKPAAKKVNEVPASSAPPWITQTVLQRPKTPEPIIPSPPYHASRQTPATPSTTDEPAANVSIIRGPAKASADVQVSDSFPNVVAPKQTPSRALAETTGNAQGPTPHPGQISAAMQTTNLTPTSSDALTFNSINKAQGGDLRRQQVSTSVQTSVSIEKAANPLTQTSGNARPPSPHPQQASESVQTANTATAPAPVTQEELMTQLDHWVRKFHDMPAPVPPKTDKERLADWAAKPPDERAKIVDAELVDILRDDNFLTLCKEVEKTWKRIGF